MRGAHSEKRKSYVCTPDFQGSVHYTKRKDIYYENVTPPPRWLLCFTPVACCSMLLAFWMIFTPASYEATESDIQQTLRPHTQFLFLTLLPCLSLSLPRFTSLFLFPFSRVNLLYISRAFHRGKLNAALHKYASYHRYWACWWWCCCWILTVLTILAMLVARERSNRVLHNSPCKIRCKMVKSIDVYTHWH